jgi:hypothetical protein
VAKHLFHFLAKFLNNKTSCKNIRERTWRISSLLNEIDKELKELESIKKKLKKDIKNKKEDVHRDISAYVDKMVQSMRVIKDVMHNIDVAVLFNCAIYYGFWLRLKRLYGSLSTMNQRVDTKEKAKKLANVLKILTSIKEGEVKKLHSDEMHWQLDIRYDGHFHISNLKAFDLRSTLRLKDDMRIESDHIEKVTAAFDEIMNGLGKGKNTLKMYEKLLSEGIQANHEDVKYAQKLAMRVEKKQKKKIEEDHLGWLRIQLNKNKKLKKKISDEDIKKIEETENAIKYLDSEIKKEMLKVFKNMIVELNIISEKEIKKVF